VRAQTGHTRGVLDWQLYIIQEYCDGGSLFDAIRAQRFWDQAGFPVWPQVRGAFLGLFDIFGLLGLFSSVDI
jgi:hypothetical protein